MNIYHNFQSNSVLFTGSKALLAVQVLQVLRKSLNSISIRSLLGHAKTLFTGTLGDCPVRQSTLKLSQHLQHTFWPLFYTFSCKSKTFSKVQMKNVPPSSPHPLQSSLARLGTRTGDHSQPPVGSIFKGRAASPRWNYCVEF